LPPETIVKSRSGKPLTTVEEQLLTAIPETTAKLLGNIPRLESVAKIILYHTKNFDGTGFPEDTVRGEAIPQGSRLLRILNDLLQLQSKGRTQADALNELHRRQGWYDPKLLASIREAFGVSAAAAESATQIIGLSLQELRSGMTLSSDVLTTDGTLVLSAGYEITGMMLGRLHNFNHLSGIKQPIFVEVPNTDSLG
jgi:HD-GYP domain-containing protein (c-di-GMP phosphodiesterase class II)